MQIQDGQNFDPTRLVSPRFLSVAVMAARRITTWMALTSAMKPWVRPPPTFPPARFRVQMSQSSSISRRILTSSGAVNVTTKSGTNAVHGEAIWLVPRCRCWRSDLRPAVPIFPPSVRSSAAVGGPVIKDKAFFSLTANVLSRIPWLRSVLGAV